MSPAPSVPPVDCNVFVPKHPSWRLSVSPQNRCLWPCNFWKMPGSIRGLWAEQYRGSLKMTAPVPSSPQSQACHHHHRGLDRISGCHRDCTHESLPQGERKDGVELPVCHRGPWASNLLASLSLLPGGAGDGCGEQLRRGACMEVGLVNKNDGCCLITAFTLPSSPKPLLPRPHPFSHPHWGPIQADPSFLPVASLLLCSEAGTEQGRGCFSSRRWWVAGPRVQLGA